MADPANPTSRRAPAQPIAGRVNYSTAAAPREPLPPRPPALSGSPDPARLLKALGRRWVLAAALGLTLAGLAAAGAWNALAPKQTAFVYIRVAASRGGPMGPQGLDNRYEFNSYLKSQISQLKSRFVLNGALNQEAVRRLNLDKKYGGEVINWLESELKVESAADNEMVKVLLSSDDPDEARTLVNAVAETYIKEVVQREEKEKAAKVAELDNIYNQANGALRDKKSQLKKQADDNLTLDSDIVKQRLAGLQAELSDTRGRLLKVNADVLKATGDVVTHKAGEKAADTYTVPESVLAEAVEADPYLRSDLNLVIGLKRRLQTIEDSYTNPEREPIWRSVKADLVAAEKRIEERRAETKKTLDSKAKTRAKLEWQLTLTKLEAQVTALQPQQETLKQLVDKLTKDIQKTGVYSAEIDTLKSEIARQESLVADIGKKHDWSKYELMAKPRVSIYHDPALMSLERKKQILGAGAGVLVSLGVACMGVAFWEFRRRRIHSADEVASGLGIPVVGAVPSSTHVEQLINATSEANEGDPVLIESFDAIRTQLLCDGEAQPTRVLMVTSAGGGEGKTTLASHLASSLARAGRRTLLIDGDLRAPAVHQFFEANLQPGLSEVLLNEVDTIDAIMATNVAGLLVLTAGQWDREVLASLARGELQGILEKLKDEFDFIVIDSHPVLSANDSLLIGRQTDGVILSVLQEVSQTPRVYAAAQRLSGLGIRVLGAVVIGADPQEVYAPTPVGYSTAAA